MRTFPATFAAVLLVALTFTTTTAIAAKANPDAGLVSVSCASSGNCSAVSTYQNAIGEGEGLLTTETAGVWGPAVQAKLPKGAAPNPMSFDNFNDLGLTQIACASAGDCAAVGTYTDTSGRIDGVLLTESHGHWQTGVDAKPPANAISEHDAYDTDPAAVACTAAGDCTVAGYYIAKGDSLDVVIFQQSNGKWSRGTELKLPSNATKFGQFALLDAITCRSAGDCLAVGSYSDSAGDQLPLIESEAGGHWSATEGELPANTAKSGKGFAILTTVACPPSGDCDAGGSYSDTSGNQQALTFEQNAGEWTQGSEMSLPAGAAGDAGDEDASVTAIRCPAAQDCTAVGSYSDTNKNQQGLLLNESDGIWTASEAPLPSGAATGVGTQSVGFTGLSCIAAGDCVASGSYDYGNSSGVPMTLPEEETGGDWSVANSVPLPANAAHEQTNFGGAVSCVAGSGDGPSVGGADCALVGGYTDKDGDVQGFASSGVGGVWGDAHELQLPGIDHAELVNSLLAVLKPKGKAGKLKAITKAHGYTYHFIAAEKGRVSSRWYATVNGHRKLIATLSASAAGAGDHKLKLKLNAAGIKLLKGAKKVRVTADATFKPAHGARVSNSAKFSLS